MSRATATKQDPHHHAAPAQAATAHKAAPATLDFDSLLLGHPKVDPSQLVLPGVPRSAYLTMMLGSGADRALSDLATKDKHFGALMREYVSQCGRREQVREELKKH